MNDKQRIKELERKKGFWKIATMSIILFFICFETLTMMGMDILKRQNTALQDALESIEGKWVLKMECQDWLDDYIYLEESFDKYEDYEFALDILDEDCEVLE